MTTLAIADTLKKIESEPNTKILLPHQQRLRRLSDPDQQNRTMTANNLGPHRCRLLGWMTKRDRKRLHNDRVQAFYQEMLTNLLLREETKRIVIDERQYADIITSPYPVPDEIAADLRWPFDDDIYIETRSPLIATEHERGVDIHHGLVILAGTEPRWVLTVETCTQLNWLGCVLGEVDLANNCYRVMNEDIDPDNFQPAEYTSYIRLLAYMTAKGIEIVDHPMPRGTRRNLEKKKLPNPWHLIRVEPKMTVADEEFDDQGSGSRHGYRYDVMGHIRFGRYKLKDGTYRTQRTWVRPHQRGLRHERYIPATRKFAHGVDKLPNDIEVFEEPDAD